MVVFPSSANVVSQCYHRWPIFLCDWLKTSRNWVIGSGSSNPHQHRPDWSFNNVCELKLVACCLDYLSGNSTCMAFRGPSYGLSRECQLKVGAFTQVRLQGIWLAWNKPLLQDFNCGATVLLWHSCVRTKSSLSQGQKLFHLNSLSTLPYQSTTNIHRIKWRERQTE